MDERRHQIETWTGHWVNPSDMRASDVHVSDIAHALSLRCRFTGHCTAFYSVAQHSVLVADILRHQGLDPLTQMWGLLHDAAEAYGPDVARPMAHLFEVWKRAEGRILAAVAAKLRLPPYSDYHTAVKKADNIALYLEAEKLMRSKGLSYPVLGWNSELDHRPYRHLYGSPMPPNLARSTWFGAFHRLSTEIHLETRKGT